MTAVWQESALSLIFCFSIPHYILLLFIRFPPHHCSYHPVWKQASLLIDTVWKPSKGSPRRHLRFDLWRKKNHPSNNWPPFVRTCPPGNASTFSGAGTFQSPAPNKGCQVAEDDGEALWGPGRSNYVTTCNGNACAVGMKASRARFECDVGKWKRVTYPFSGLLVCASLLLLFAEMPRSFLAK